MTPAAFKSKWAKFSGKESAAYAEHFNDLCRMLGVPMPIEADSTGNDSFCFQKRVAKDAELFDFDADGTAEPARQERGFADVATGGDKIRPRLDFGALVAHGDAKPAFLEHEDNIGHISEGCNLPRRYPVQSRKVIHHAAFSRPGVSHIQVIWL
jgi:hypothetical protein